jgi:hypothetical protein
MRPNQHRKAKHPFSFVALRILDWLDSQTQQPVLIPIEGPDWATREGGSEWEPIKILSLKEVGLYPDCHLKTHLCLIAKMTQVN